MMNKKTWKIENILPTVFLYLLIYILIMIYKLELDMIIKMCKK